MKQSTTTKASDIEVMINQINSLEGTSDVEVYDRQLSQEEIIAQYNSLNLEKQNVKEAVIGYFLLGMILVSILLMLILIKNK